MDIHIQVLESLSTNIPVLHATDLENAICAKEAGIPDAVGAAAAENVIIVMGTTLAAVVMEEDITKRITESFADFIEKPRIRIHRYFSQTVSQKEEFFAFCITGSAVNNIVGRQDQFQRLAVSGVKQIRLPSV